MTSECSGPVQLTSPSQIYAWSALPVDHTPAAALFALDATLGDIVRSTREPLVGQMRLTWWHDSLTALDTVPAPAQPVLQALARHVVPRVPGSALADMVEGWEVLLDAADPDDAALALFGERRGAGLFAAVAQASGVAVDEAVRQAGTGWALTDLAANVAAPALRMRARRLAEAALDRAMARKWPARLRGVGGLAVDARCALGGIGTAGSPRRSLAVLRFRILGR